MSNIESGMSNDEVKGTQPERSHPERLQSLDAYRGLIMVTLAFGGFGLASTASRHLEAQPDSTFWETFWEIVGYQFSHATWVGCSYWDLIQPSFMFMVGVSMAYSYAKRSSSGHSWTRMFSHAIWRSILLSLLGIFLISNWGGRTNWSLMNVLTQIGLGYTFLFLFWRRPFGVQAIGAAAILVGTWLLHVLFPGTGIDLSPGAPDIGIDKEWAENHLSGVGSSWHKNANVGHMVDLWLLNLLPRQEPFEFSAGGYQTINFIPSLATMLFGLMSGELLRSERPARRKLQILLAIGVGGLLVGQLLHTTGVCPLVKRIWTPSWAVFSTGWCCLFLAGLYGVIDVLGWKRWAFPLVVVGINSIAMYCMGMLLKPWTRRTFQTHLGEDVFTVFGQSWEPAVQSIAVGLFFWLICYWMYRRRIFLRL